MGHSVSMKVSSAVLSCFLMASCTALPASGPWGEGINGGAAATLKGDEKLAKLGYALVDITRRTLDNTGDQGPGSLYSSFKGGRGAAPEILVGVGDVVQVTVFESREGGLFIPADAGSRNGNYVTIPQQTVDRRGTISVPYAGVIRAAGRQISAIQRDIESRLANKAIEPQVVVSVVTQNANAASVTGDVNLPAKFTVNASGDRILDAIARAGGLKYEGWQSYVTLQRKGKSATIFFNRLVSTPAENIYVAPGDTIYVYRQQRSYLAFGAAGLNGQFNFQDEKVSMAQALAQAGGLLDARANPGEVYLYRLESRKSLAAQGVNLAAFSPNAETIPTIYKANLRDPGALFITQYFMMHDKDIIYISNARAYDLYKFLELISAVTGTTATSVVDVADTKTAVRVIGH